MAMATARRQEKKRHGCQGLETIFSDHLIALKKLDDSMARKKAGERRQENYTKEDT